MAYAYVTVKVRVRAQSRWSGNTTVDQVSRQAKEDALGQINKSLSGTEFKIVGEPEVTAVHTDITPDTLITEE